VDEQGKILLSTMQQNGVELATAEPITNSLLAEMFAPERPLFPGGDDAASYSAGEGAADNRRVEKLVTFGKDATKQLKKESA
jgi:hypothetical protein